MSDFVASPAERTAARGGLAMARLHLDPASVSEDHLEHCDMGDACPFVPGWTTSDHAIGLCVVCGERCRSKDPDGRLRHFMCPIEEA